MVGMCYGVDSLELSHDAKIASGKLTFLCIMDSH